MKRLSRHLPLVILAAILLCGVACGTDEPRGKDHGTQGGSTPVPHDTTRNNTNPPDTTSNDTTHNSTNPPDTTHNSTNDTTTTFSITLNVPRTIGYMGQTMQLNAVTTAPATVKWQSSRAAIATVDAEGLVTFCPTDADGTAVITATAGGVSDTVTLTNRCWHVAVWDGSAWSVPATRAIPSSSRSPTARPVSSMMGVSTPPPASGASRAAMPTCRAPSRLSPPLPRQMVGNIG